MENNYHKFFFKNGYCKIKLFSPRDIKNFLNGVDNRIESLCPNIYKLNKKTKLKNFHKLNLSENLRKKVINPDTRYLKMNKLTTLSASSKKKIFKLMKEFWGHNKYCIYWVGSAKKKQIKHNAIGFRIVRPNEKKDGGWSIEMINPDFYYMEVGDIVAFNNSAMSSAKAFASAWTNLKFVITSISRSIGDLKVDLYEVS